MLHSYRAPDKLSKILKPGTETKILKPGTEKSLAPKQKKVHATANGLAPGMWRRRQLYRPRQLTNAT